MIAIITRKSLLLILLAAALAVSGCAALQPPSATGPRSTGSLYPVLLTEDSRRQEVTVAALHRLLQSSGNSSPIEPQLQPVTGATLSLPSSASGALLLPRVGASPVMNEEETRESLRRFIKQLQEVIGADPAKLSLVASRDLSDGSKLAEYEHRPFRYPIRGNYGKLQIHFTGDRRVLDFTSTCVRDSERIQNALSALNVRPKAEDAVQQLRAKGLNYADAGGNKLTFIVTASSEINARGLVIYILPSKTAAETLEFHLAWEMELSNAPVKIAYIDAVSGEVIAAE